MLLKYIENSYFLFKRGKVVSMQQKKYNVYFKLVLLGFLIQFNTFAFAAEGDSRKQPIKIYMWGVESSRQEGVILFRDGGEENLEQIAGKWYTFIRNNKEIEVGELFNIYEVKDGDKKALLQREPGNLVGEVKVIRNGRIVKSEVTKKTKYYKPKSLYIVISKVDLGELNGDATVIHGNDEHIPVDLGKSVPGGISNKNNSNIKVNNSVKGVEYNIRSGSVYWGEDDEAPLIIHRNKYKIRNGNNDWYYALSYCSNLRKNYYTNCIQNKIENLYNKNIFSIADILFKIRMKEDEIYFSSQVPELKKSKVVKKGEFETTSQFEDRLVKEREQTRKYNDDAIKKLDIYKNNKLKELNENRKDYKYKDKVYLGIIKKILYIKYRYPKIDNIKYNADGEYLSARLYSVNKKYNENINIPVKIKYAKVFKELLLKVRSNPVIEFRVLNNKLIFDNVKQLNNPEFSVEKKEFYECYKINHFHNFIKKYPNSVFVSKAKEEINAINQKNQKKLESRKSAEISEKNNRKRKDKSYSDEKYIGDKVCKDGTTAIILPITITAYVERINGNKIQLRISDTEGTSPYYNGVTLTRNSLVWDNYYTWYRCNY